MSAQFQGSKKRRLDSFKPSGWEENENDRIPFVEEYKYVKNSRYDTRNLAATPTMTAKTAARMTAEEIETRAERFVRMVSPQ
jgi:hypothetical protein